MWMENVKLAGSETIKLFNDRENVREKPRLMIPSINSCVWRWALSPAQMLKFVLARCFLYCHNPWANTHLRQESKSKWEREREMEKIHGRGTWSFHLLRCHLIHIKGSARLHLNALQGTGTKPSPNPTPPTPPSCLRKPSCNVITLIRLQGPRWPGIDQA